MKTITTYVLEVGDIVYFTGPDKRAMLADANAWIVTHASDLGRDGNQMLTVRQKNTERRVLAKYIQEWMGDRFEIEEI